jgi:hypothetical protein
VEIQKLRRGVPVWICAHRCAYAHKAQHPQNLRINNQIHFIMSTRAVVKLKGDYVDHHERQEQARQAGCRLVVEFHFNSNGSTAIGGETWYKPGDTFSRQVASDIRSRHHTIGLPLHGDGPHAAVQGTRASWIRHYDQGAILLEPLFVSNPGQAAWIHEAANVVRLAEQVAEAIVNATQDSDVIGLSVGHRYKTTNPHDEGAPCRGGDDEADHNEALCNKVAELLSGNNEENDDDEMHEALAKGVINSPDGEANVRSGPSQTHEILAVLHNGDKVDIYARSGQWRRIAPSQEQWAHGSLIRIAENGGTGITLSWEDGSHPARTQWTKQLVASVRQNKSQLDQGDPNGFIPGYNGLSDEGQIKFWCELFVAMSKFESNWKPTEVYQEASGQNSIGLFQLSIGDQENYHLTPHATSEKDLKDPFLNIQWAVTILAHWTVADRLIATGVAGDNRGGARYWSVLRGGSSHHYAEIRNLTKEHSGLA